MDTEIIKGIMSLVLGIGFIILIPYFLYTVLWWFPLIFIGGLITGEILKKDSLDFLSPFIIVQMTFPHNRKVQILIGLAVVLLSFVGSYIFLSESRTFFAFFSAFIGALTLLGIILSVRSKV